MSNSLSKCFEFETELSASADLLIKYCFTAPRSKTLTNILMQNVNNILNSKFGYADFSNFFKNPELENESKLRCSFSHLLLD